MRAYTVAAAAFALRVPVKFVDNMLTHHHVAGVIKSRQGIARRLSPGAILALEITLRLNRSLAIPLGKALELANTMVQTDQRGVVHLPHHLSLRADLVTIEADLDDLLGQAVEVAPTPRRGRPPGK